MHSPDARYVAFQSSLSRFGNSWRSDRYLRLPTPKRDITVARGIERAPVASAVNLQAFFFRNKGELLLMFRRKQTVGLF